MALSIISRLYFSAKFVPKSPNIYNVSPPGLICGADCVVSCLTLVMVRPPLLELNVRPGPASNGGKKVIIPFLSVKYLLL